MNTCMHIQAHMCTQHVHSGMITFPRAKEQDDKTKTKSKILLHNGSFVETGLELILWILRLISARLAVPVSWLL